MKRSSSVYNPLTKRTEQMLTSVDPLKTALGLFGADKGGSAYASGALDSADTLLLNKFPAAKMNAYITGMSGKWTTPTKISIGGTTFAKGANVPYVVRWDYDPIKGPHVNFAIGKGDQQTKFAVQQDMKSLPANTTPAQFMQQTVQNLNQQAGGYDTKLNIGKSTPTFPNGQTAEETLSNLRSYFQSVSSGPC